MSISDRKLKERQNRIDEIKQATMAVIEEYGLENITMDLIAAKAELSKPVIYYYFKNKDEVIFEIIKEISENYLSGIEDITKKDLSFCDFLSDYIDYCYNFKNSLTILNSVTIEQILTYFHQKKDVFDYMFKEHLKDTNLIYNMIKSYIEKNVIKNVNIITVVIMLQTITDKIFFAEKLFKEYYSEVSDLESVKSTLKTLFLNGLLCE